MTKKKKESGSIYKKVNPGPFYSWPMGLWFSLFFIVPIVIIVVYSFLKRNIHGSVLPVFSLEAYKKMFSPAYGLIFLRTMKITVISTVITILMALPCGYAMARSKHQTLLLILVVIPFLTNSLIRIFAWITILGENGILNHIGEFFFDLWHKLFPNPEAVFKPGKFMNTNGAVILVSVYMYLPYAILPIFTSVDKFDFSLLEAARDLGATKPQSMRKVLLPSIRSGIISALIFTFIPIFGSYVIPNLVGGMESYMLGNLIVDHVTKTRDWPLSAAVSLFLTIISMIGIFWMMNSNKKDEKLKEDNSTDDDSDNISISESLNKEALAAGGNN